jgi:hypothetical protein
MAPAPNGRAVTFLTVGGWSEPERSPFPPWPHFEATSEAVPARSPCGAAEGAPQPGWVA